MQYAVLSLSGKALTEFHNIATAIHGLAIKQTNSWMDYLEKYEVRQLTEKLCCMVLQISNAIRFPIGTKLSSRLPTGLALTFSTPKTLVTGSPMALFAQLTHFLNIDLER